MFGPLGFVAGSTLDGVSKSAILKIIINFKDGKKSLISTTKGWYDSLRLDLEF